MWSHCSHPRYLWPESSNTWSSFTGNMILFSEKILCNSLLAYHWQYYHLLGFIGANGIPVTTTNKNVDASWAPSWRTSERNGWETDWSGQAYFTYSSKQTSLQYMYMCVCMHMHMNLEICLRSMCLNMYQNFFVQFIIIRAHLFVQVFQFFLAVKRVWFIVMRSTRIGRMSCCLLLFFLRYPSNPLGLCSYWGTMWHPIRSIVIVSNILFCLPKIY